MCEGIKLEECTKNNGNDLKGAIFIENIPHCCRAKCNIRAFWLHEQ